MGECEVMTEYTFEIRFPSAERLMESKDRFEKIRAMHNTITKEVLGHDAVVEGWLIFDDCLKRSYTHHKDLLKALEERAG